MCKLFESNNVFSGSASRVLTFHKNNMTIKLYVYMCIIILNITSIFDKQKNNIGWYILCAYKNINKLNLQNK